MPNNIKITPASALIEFSGASSSNITLTVASNGDVVYSGTTNGEAFRVSDASNAVTIKSASFGTHTLSLNKTAGGTNTFSFLDAGVIRWRFASGSTNTFSLARYNSSGVLQDNPIVIDPSNGEVTIASLRIGAGYVPWTSNNDGAGSGLDADLLDGQQGSYYTNWNNITTNRPTTLAGYGITDAQALDAGLTSIAALTGAGVLTATATDTFVMRAIGVASSSDLPDRAAADTRYVQLGGSTLTGYLTLHADPSNAMHPATKQYVDALVQGLDPKGSVKAASTANITLTAPGATIDGVTMVNGDLFLAKDQTTPAQNGIYVWTGAATAATRATNMNAWSEVPGSHVWVEQGSTLADTGWVCTADQNGTLETTAITWQQFGGPGSFTAGTGLALSGNQFSLTGQALSLHNLATTGFIRRTGANTFSASAIVNADLPISGIAANTYRSVTVNDRGIVVEGTNPTTLAGYGITDAQALDAGLTSIAALTGAGVLTATATDTFVMRSIGVASATDIPDRAAADTRYALSSATYVNSFNTRTGAVTLTSGDVTGALTYTPVNPASATFTGTVSVGTNTIQGSSASNLLSVDDANDDAFIAAGRDIALIIDSDNSGTTATFSIKRNASTIAGSAAIFTVAEAGAVTMSGTLDGVADPTSGTMVGSRGYNDLRYALKATTLAGYGITDAQGLDATLTALAALNTTTGLVVQTGTDTFTKRSIDVGSGLSINNASGAAGNPTISLDAGLVSIAGLTGAGVLTATATDAFAMRAIGASANTDILDRAAADARYPILVAGTNTFTGAISLNSASPSLRFVETDQTAPAGGWFINANNDTLYIRHNTATPVDFSSMNIALTVSSTEIVNFTNTPTVGASNSVWHAGNDGAASGLDADLLDGQHGSYYNDAVNLTGTIDTARLPAVLGTDRTINSSLFILGSTPYLALDDSSYTTGTATGLWRWYSNAGALYLRRNTSTDRDFATQDDDIIINASGTITFRTNPYVSGNVMWHAGNDGSASGLDADLLDGQHGSYYAPIADPTFTGIISGPNLRIDGADFQEHATNTDTAALYLNYRGYSGGTTRFRDTYVGTGKAAVMAWFDGSSGDVHLGGSAVASAPVTTIKGTGNVGIGITDPASQLEVGKSTGGVIAISTNGVAGTTGSPLAPTLNFLGYIDQIKGAISVDDRSSSVVGGWMKFKTADTSAVLQDRMIIDNTGSVSFSSTALLASGNTIWHAGNDGASSGLDADLLDGQQGSYYYPVSGGTITGNVTMAKATPTWVFNDTAQVAPATVGLFRLYSAAGNLYYTRNTSTTRDFAPETSVMVITGSTGVVNFNTSPFVGASVLWNAGNDGAGSGLDADLLDGVQLTQIVRNDVTNQNLASNIYFSNGRSLSIGYSGGNYGGFGYNINFTGTADTHTCPSTDTATWVHLASGGLTVYSDPGGAASRTATWTALLSMTASAITYKGNAIWHAGNDGTSSGLDADLLDGLQSTSFLRSDSPYNSVVPVAATAGNGIRFWGGSDQYSIWMSTATEGTWGGRVSGETTSDYNMYFRMGGGTNRGFVFMGGAAGTTAVGGIDGAGNLRVTADIVGYASDERLKKNVKRIENALEKIAYIGGYTFDWDQELVDSLGFSPYQYDNEHGFLAQRVAVKVPDAIRPAPFNDKYLTVKYERLVPLAFEGINELAEENASLKNKLSAIEEELNELKTVLRAKGLI